MARLLPVLPCRPAVALENGFALSRGSRWAPAQHRLVGRRPSMAPCVSIASRGSTCRSARAGGERGRSA